MTLRSIATTSILFQRSAGAVRKSFILLLRSMMIISTAAPMACLVAVIPKGDVTSSPASVNAKEAPHTKARIRY
jgi:hypothetical protein